ncbi:AMP-binding protein [Szabonella alba]|uniref:AMP-binding protein n=1 Tax=Szabonella alba TaxID=2804194 RepID=A0A8K0VA62_9RHOB|nr:AMP-binding protein [Szabonella alba]MBL4918474.1 AMP-binding protein [Szabonella alba]
MSDLLRDFAAAVARHPDRIALIDGRGRDVTFAALQARAVRMAADWQRQGIGPGDRVLLAMRLDADLYAALAALWSLGATVVLPEPAMGLAGLRHAARVTRPRAFCSSGAYGLLKYLLPALWPLTHLRPSRNSAVARSATDAALPPPSGADIALISFTSGTGGAPKAIPRSHDFLAAQHRAIAPMLDSDREERDLVAFPVFVLINIASGRSSVLPSWRMSRLDRLRPGALRKWIETRRATRALLPPALCRTLARAGGATGLRHLFTGGGPVFPGLLEALNRVAPDLRVTCVYGSTEAEPIAHLDAVSITPADRAEMQGGGGLLVGHPVAALGLRLQEDEIQVAGDHVNRGYLDPAQDAGTKIREGGVIWHRTGDAGRLDAQGRLWLLGRKGDEVRIAGCLTHPFPLELAARQWPGVVQAALIGRAGQACLYIEGETTHLPDWQDRAHALGIDAVIPLARMPMDRRHRSKIDRKALKSRN